MNDYKIVDLSELQEGQEFKLQLKEKTAITKYLELTGCFEKKGNKIIGYDEHRSGTWTIEEFQIYMQSLSSERSYGYYRVAIHNPLTTKDYWLDALKAFGVGLVCGIPYIVYIPILMLIFHIFSSEKRADSVATHWQKYFIDQWEPLSKLTFVIGFIISLRICWHYGWYFPKDD